MKASSTLLLASGGLAACQTRLSFDHRKYCVHYDDSWVSVLLAMLNGSLAGYRVEWSHPYRQLTFERTR